MSSQFYHPHQDTGSFRREMWKDRKSWRIGRRTLKMLPSAYGVAVAVMNIAAGTTDTGSAQTWKQGRSSRDKSWGRQEWEGKREVGGENMIRRPYSDKTAQGKREPRFLLFCKLAHPISQTLFLFLRKSRLLGSYFLLLWFNPFQTWNAELKVGASSEWCLSCSSINEPQK